MKRHILPLLMVTAFMYSLACPYQVKADARVVKLRVPGPV